VSAFSFQPRLEWAREKEEMEAAHISSLHNMTTGLSEDTICMDGSTTDNPDLIMELQSASKESQKQVMEANEELEKER
jgi:hypothetical protein